MRENFQQDCELWPKNSFCLSWAHIAHINIYIYIIYLWGHITIGQQPVKSSYDTTMKYFTWTGSSGGATPEEELVEPEAVARRSCSESGSLSFQQS